MRHDITVNGHQDAMSTICAQLDAWCQQGDSGPWWPEHVSRRDLDHGRPRPSKLVLRHDRHRTGRPTRRDRPALTYPSNERDDDAVELWKKEVWLRVEAPRAARAGPGSCKDEVSQLPRPPRAGQDLGPVDRTPVVRGAGPHHRQPRRRRTSTSWPPP
jgi:hypothetical protein